jgi:hypothetical protein
MFHEFSFNIFDDKYELDENDPIELLLLYETK